MTPADKRVMPLHVGFIIRIHTHSYAFIHDPIIMRRWGDEKKTRRISNKSCDHVSSWPPSQGDRETGCEGVMMTTWNSRRWVIYDSINLPYLSSSTLFRIQLSSFWYSRIASITSFPPVHLSHPFIESCWNIKANDSWIPDPSAQVPRQRPRSHPWDADRLFHIMKCGQTCAALTTQEPVGTGMHDRWAQERWWNIACAIHALPLNSWTREELLIKSMKRSRKDQDLDQSGWERRVNVESIFIPKKEQAIRPHVMTWQHDRKKP